MADRQAEIVDRAHRAASGARGRSDESWVDISSLPSTSSLSSAADESVTSRVRLQAGQRPHRRRRAPPAQTVPPTQQEARLEGAQDLSSQEEYDESESESDRVMTSSGEEPHGRDIADLLRESGVPESSRIVSSVARHNVESDDDENKTAVNYPINSGNVFTPQPNAFSHPPATQVRSASQPVPGSYFPTIRRLAARQTDFTSRPRQQSETQSHLPRNILSPSFNAAAHHDEALRSSLSTLLSCAAAARGLKSDAKQGTSTSTTIPQHSNRIEPASLRLVPESALPTSSPAFDLQAPIFKPTLRRHSTTTTSTSPDRAGDKAKRSGRASSKERRVAKKARHSSSADELFVSPTLLTWVVSAGVVVVLSALSFSAGYSMGREAGRMETGSVSGMGASNSGIVKDCAREASRGGLGLKRGLARSAVQV